VCRFVHNNMPPPRRPGLEPAKTPAGRGFFPLARLGYEGGSLRTGTGAPIAGLKGLAKGSSLFPIKSSAFRTRMELFDVGCYLPLFAFRFPHCLMEFFDVGCYQCRRPSKANLMVPPAA